MSKRRIIIRAVGNETHIVLCNLPPAEPEPAALHHCGQSCKTTAEKSPAGLSRARRERLLGVRGILMAQEAAQQSLAGSTGLALQEGARAALSGHGGCRAAALSSLRCSVSWAPENERENTAFPVFPARGWWSVTLIWQIWPQKPQSRVAQLHKSKTYLGFRWWRRKP